MSWLVAGLARIPWRRFLLPLVAACLTLPMARLARGYSWPQSLVSAAAIGTLAYGVRRTAEQVQLARRAHHIAELGDDAPRGSFVERAEVAPAPRPEQAGGEEHEVDQATCDPADKQEKEP